MKKSIQKFLTLLVVAFIVSATTIRCNEDDDDVEPTLTGESKTYTLSSVTNPGISGSVKFSERSDNSTLVTIDLDGTTSGNTHPAHIHANTAAETGDIIIELNPVDGATGMSETTIKKRDDGTAISYDDLLELDGYVNVHVSETEAATLIAQGDVGINELTNTFIMYDLAATNESGITGTVTFTKRVSGSTLVVVDLDGAGTTGEYPVSIFTDDVTTGGSISIDLSTVDGTTGLSVTEVSELNSGSAITYDQLIDYDGHVSVSASLETPEVFVAQTNIGSND